jgi:TorS N-terminal sensor domain
MEDRSGRRASGGSIRRLTRHAAAAGSCCSCLFRWRVGQATFAGPPGNGRIAPFADFIGLGPGHTDSGPSSTTLIDRRIDPILAALEVSRSVQRIVSSSANLAAATTEHGRQEVVDGLAVKSNKLRSLLKQLRDGGISDKRVGPIEQQAGLLDANLRALDRLGATRTTLQH